VIRQFPAADADALVVILQWVIKRALSLLRGTIRTVIDGITDHDGRSHKEKTWQCDAVFLKEASTLVLYLPLNLNTLVDSPK
jgi:hypothetical protein